jgi:hypothetical protein
MSSNSNNKGGFQGGKQSVKVPAPEQDTKQVTESETTGAPEASVDNVTQPPVDSAITQLPNVEPGTVFVGDTPSITSLPVLETTTQPPVVETTTKPPVADIEVDGVQLSVFENRVQWIKEHGSTNEKHVLVVMENYVKIGQSSVNLNDIAIEQQRLWRLFEYIHNQPAEFQKLYTLLLDFAKEYKDTLFNLSTFFRAQSGLSLAVDQLSAFNNLRTLVLNTIQTKDISMVKTLLDIRKIVEHDAIPEHIRGMYVAFYN